jgi:hypothetical protein
MALATAHGLEHRVAYGRIHWGWARAMQGDVATGVAHIHQGKRPCEFLYSILGWATRGKSSHRA